MSAPRTWVFCTVMAIHLAAAAQPGKLNCRPLLNIDEFNPTQICWGRAELGTTGGHVRTFNITFELPFAEAPVVTTSIDAKSIGYAYAIYNSAVTDKNYTGDVVEIQFRPNTAPVTFSYMAIGKALK